MTLAEYTDKTRPMFKVPTGSVVVHSEDCLSISWRLTTKEKMKYVELTLVIDGDPIRYGTRRGSLDGVLYTLDEHGNPKSPSVFKLVL